MSLSVQRHVAWLQCRPWRRLVPARTSLNAGSIVQPVQRENLLPPPCFVQRENHEEGQEPHERALIQ
eukprot:3008473-Rhodomonas_salina.1